jgi:uncharacterized protein
MSQSELPPAGEGSSVDPPHRWSMPRIVVSSIFIAGAYVFSQIVGLSLGLAVATRSGRAADAEEWLARVGGDGLALGILTLASAVVCLPAILWVTARVESHPLRFLGFAPVPWRALLVPCAALLGLLAAYETVNWMLGRPHVHPFVAEAYASAGSVALLALALVVAAPLAEETAFRGFLFAALRQHFGVAACAVVTALLWSVVHVQYDAVDQGYIFALGLLLAWARARSGSIAAPISMHAAVNLLAIAQVAIAA